MTEKFHGFSENFRGLSEKFRAAKFFCAAVGTTTVDSACARPLVARATKGRAQGVVNRNSTKFFYIAVPAAVNMGISNLVYAHARTLYTHRTVVW